MLDKHTLRKRLKYDPETGVFCHIEGSNTFSRANGFAGSKDKDGYIRIQLAGRNYAAHRLAWLFFYGAWPAHQIDHINGDPADNRIANLRDVEQIVNMHNVCAPTRASSTGLRGVSFHAGKFVAQISINNKTTVLGRFDSAEDAHRAYLRAKTDVMARLGAEIGVPA